MWDHNQTGTHALSGLPFGKPRPGRTAALNDVGEIPQIDIAKIKASLKGAEAWSRDSGWTAIKKEPKVSGVFEEVFEPLSKKPYDFLHDARIRPSPTVPMPLTRMCTYYQSRRRVLTCRKLSRTTPKTLIQIHGTILSHRLSSERATGPPDVMT
ncbi:hypothetical protein BKA82DRAFT_320416 [Pisolithus tinctorius]|uniref:Uncharacterized protein n=1 Tax=Pisolithus tinctorius Marx 270 TaxID=870435 RepID=A0A0C3NI54_PISTI|nr:hypothetical protein BKA82DRAFT_320416 [Pisolithus tinctorius]KIN95340.1 hypothetical protein M404DRAFT_320416 [Pisolithus tinctorius Marx 270]